tara:strand:- start:30 stop:302 length:273 start_codon:yes stop_codon:yes gene_type:complete
MDNRQEIRDAINALANDELQYRMSETKEERISGQIIRLTQLLDRWTMMHIDAIKNHAIDVEIEFLENNINNTKEQINVKENELLELQENL